MLRRPFARRASRGRPLRAPPDSGGQVGDLSWCRRPGQAMREVPKGSPCSRTVHLPSWGGPALSSVSPALREPGASVGSSLGLQTHTGRHGPGSGHPAPRVISRS